MMNSECDKFVKELPCKNWRNGYSVPPKNHATTRTISRHLLE